MRPALGYAPGELQHVQRARHVDVGKQQVDLRLALKHPPSLVGRVRLHDVEAGLLQHVDRDHADDRFIFHDEYGRACGGRSVSHPEMARVRWGAP